jgi:hypothetical protein
MDMLAGPSPLFGGIADERLIGVFRFARSVGRLFGGLLFWRMVLKNRIVCKTE